LVGLYPSLQDAQTLQILSISNNSYDEDETVPEGDCIVFRFTFTGERMGVTEGTRTISGHMTAEYRTSVDIGWK
jgi:hypothetical protein